MIGRLVGTILDGEGFVAGLHAAGYEVRGKSVAFVGAGGVVTSVAFFGRAGGARPLRDREPYARESRRPSIPIMRGGAWEDCPRSAGESPLAAKMPMCEGRDLPVK